MNITINFPDTPEQFLDTFSFTDIEEYYTNGQRCITLHRVRQMLEHYFAERTCHDTAHFDGCFECSACGEQLEDPRQEPNFVKWCPFCGAKVVDE